MKESKKQLLRAAGLGIAVDLLEEGKCPLCGKEKAQDTIKDSHSMKEFEISGMCQRCQDEMFRERVEAQDDR